jgi:hypothetical protein
MLLAQEAKPAPGRSGRRGRGKPGAGLEDGSREARRRAAVILEVLAGQRLPSQAGEELGISLSRYYLVETKALKGLVAACEPGGGKKGRQVRPERKMELLDLEVERLKRELARHQALVRASQRAVGIGAARAEVKGKAQGKDGKARKRKRRRPTVRALLAVERLREESRPAEVTPGAGGP